jgi:signal transduction histidine kinase
MVLSGFGAFFLSSRALRPVDRITRTAKEIGEKDLRQRIPIKSNDELGRLASTLNQMIARLEVAFERQRQFAADASHELRTPLSVIRAESTLSLANATTLDEYRKSLDLISQEADHMSSIIEQLLFLARNDAGQEPLNLVSVNIKELLTDISADVEVLTRDKGLQFNLGPIDNVNVKGDRVKLKQLLMNILTNAIRYTPPFGKITTTTTKKKEILEVDITDTGPGISPEHLPYIFQRFYRVDSARSGSEGGAGLGLSIAQSIAESHGGKIEVESQLAKGSTFKIYLPILNDNKAKINI